MTIQERSARALDALATIADRVAGGVYRNKEDRETGTPSLDLTPEVVGLPSVIRPWHWRKRDYVVPSWKEAESFGHWFVGAALTETSMFFYRAHGVNPFSDKAPPEHEHLVERRDRRDNFRTFSVEEQAAGPGVAEVTIDKIENADTRGSVVLSDNVEAQRKAMYRGVINIGRGLEAQFTKGPTSLSREGALFDGSLVRPFPVITISSDGATSESGNRRL